MLEPVTKEYLRKARLVQNEVLLAIALHRGGVACLLIGRLFKRLGFSMNAAKSFPESADFDSIPACLQQLVTQSLELMACYGCDRRYLAVSPPLIEALDCSADMLLHRTNRALADAAEQSHSPVVARHYWQQVDEALTTVLQQGKPQRRTHPVWTIEGSRIYDTTYTPICDAHGQVRQILSISREALPQVSSPSSRSSIPASSLAAASTVGAQMPLKMPLMSRSLSPAVVATEQTTWSLEASTTSASAIAPAAGAVHQTTEFMQLVLDNILQHIFWKDRNSVYLGCNRRWADMAGIGDPNDVVGLTDDDLPWTAAEREWYLACDRQVMKTDTPMLRIKQSQREADGRITWRETSKLPLHDADGNVIGLLGAIEDITERKAAEDLMTRSRETFEQLAKQKELLNQVSAQIRKSLKPGVIQQTTVHEIRQMLSADRVVIYRFEEDWRGQVTVESVVPPWHSTLGNIGADNCFAEDYAELYRR
ncbi:MAG: PAS domain-containing protein, partial [Elainellaceae cyanobacterium]